MTTLQKEVQRLPKAEKISLMEQIWTELSSETDPLDMPEWHAAELESTEKRIDAGKETFEDWSEVKVKLIDE